MIENTKNGKPKKLTVLNRKVDFYTFIGEFIPNLGIIYIIYGALDDWNPMKWNLGSKIMALFFLCIYYPYRDAKRAIRKQQEEEKL
jgi:hypothetical protein